jgi:hypothetical protein
VKTGVRLFLIYRPIYTIFVKSRLECVILGQKDWFWAIRVGLMRMRGVEPPRAEAHRHLKPARLPIPPHPQGLLFAHFPDNNVQGDNNINDYRRFVKNFNINLFRNYFALLKTWTVILRRKKACPERSRRAEESHFLSNKEILHSAARSLSSSEAKDSDLSLSNAKE